MFKGMLENLEITNLSEKEEEKLCSDRTVNVDQTPLGL